MKVIKWILSLVVSVVLILSLFATSFVFSAYKNDFMAILAEMGLDFDDFDDFDDYDYYDGYDLQNNDYQRILEMIENGNFDEKEIREKVDKVFSDPKQQQLFIDLLKQNSDLVRFYLRVSDLDIDELLSLLDDYPEMQQEIKKIVEEK